jgi:hypothetical protein
MRWEIASIHLGTRCRAVVKDVIEDLKQRKANWLKKSAEKMTAATLSDWAMWRGEWRLPQTQP